MRLLIVLAACLTSFVAEAVPWRARVDVEAGAVWQGRNDIRIPRSGGTDFSLSDFDAGPFAFGRVRLWGRLAERHSLRVLIAPFEVTVNGAPSGSIDFNGTTFASGVPLEGNYKFSSYRLAYLYSFAPLGRTELSLGFSAKIRDARVRLTQGSLSAEDTNLGFVPLLVVNVSHRLAPRWWLEFDLEGLAAPQGRAFDAALLARYELDDHFDVGFGYRMLEGGADAGNVYTFAWLHYATATLGARW